MACSRSVPRCARFLCWSFRFWYDFAPDPIEEQRVTLTLSCSHNRRTPPRSSQSWRKLQPELSPRLDRVCCCLCLCCCLTGCIGVAAYMGWLGTCSPKASPNITIAAVATSPTRMSRGGSTPAERPQALSGESALEARPQLANPGRVLWLQERLPSTRWPSSFVVVSRRGATTT